MAVLKSHTGWDIRRGMGKLLSQRALPKGLPCDRKLALGAGSRPVIWIGFVVFVVHLAKCLSNAARLVRWTMAQRKCSWQSQLWHDSVFLSLSLSLYIYIYVYMSMSVSLSLFLSSFFVLSLSLYLSFFLSL